MNFVREQSNVETPASSAVVSVMPEERI